MVYVPLRTRHQVVHEVISWGEGDLGDLVLLMRHAPIAHREDFAYFGVLKQFNEDTRELTLENVMVLYPTRQLGGQPVHMIQPPVNDAAIRYNGDYAWVIHNLNLIRRGWMGQDKIVRGLQDQDTFRAYADWIARMEKPYNNKK